MISGMVNVFARIEPNRVNLSGVVGERIVATVEIVPEKQYPFKILDSSSDNKDKIRFAIENKSDRYQILVENTATEAGRYWDNIRIKTDSSIMPEIQINVFGNILTSSKQ